MDKDLYDLPPEEGKAIPTVSSSLEMSLAALDEDRGFLTAGGVFSDILRLANYLSTGVGYV